MELDHYFDLVKESLVLYGPEVVGSIVVLLIGLWVIKVITTSARKLMMKKKIDHSLIPFLISTINISLKTLLVITVMSMLGIAMTSFIAILGAAGLAIGMALSGTLQNLAGGVMILIFKPFKLGDFIEAQGYAGVVKEIQIFNTLITTPDNKLIIIPNGGLSTSSMVNYSTEPTRRVDFSFSISYSDSIDLAKEVIMAEIEKNKMILNQPAPFIAVGMLADSSVNLVVRVWVDTPNYWNVNFAMLEGVKKAFDSNKITIPFPQTEVHIHSSNTKQN